jgi:hypothetical protein
LQRAFATYGQDFRRDDQSELMAYLGKHEENGVIGQFFKISIYLTWINNASLLIRDLF